MSAALHPESDSRYGFHQSVADNADVNVGILGGHGIFHSMGMIECITPKVNDDNSHGILRVTGAPSPIVLGTFGHVPIQTFEKRIPPSDIDTMIFEKICDANPIMPRLFDLLWLYGKSDEFPCIRGWNGFMEGMISKKSTRCLK